MYQCPTCAVVVVGNLRRWPHFQYASCPMTLCKEAPDAARMTDGGCSWRCDPKDTFDTFDKQASRRVTTSCNHGVP
jgi:hypothetical protein